ncbi:SirB2 family protein [Alteromonadaceae bacterium BrNp21-10]|nr:SirB2 family protein [Alteromonadaceae bacterium BrNp21-10]
MSSLYPLLKHIHLVAIAFSVFLFAFRFYWQNTQSSIMSKKWVKVAPHIIDTILLVSAIGLCFTIAQYPLANAWLTEKVILVIGYIIFGLSALNINKSKVVRWSAFGLAIACILLIGRIATSKQALFLS